jgi:sulfur relay (sulfurtransferase) complex TusBCD TusD component (DsrE family)
MVNETGKRGETLALVLFTAPYGNQYADHLCHIADKALEKGYSVEIFLYGDAVHSSLTGQRPKNLFNVGEALAQLADRGATIYSCLICAIARGCIKDYDEAKKAYNSTITLPFIKYVTVQGFVSMIKKADRLMMFGSS